VTTPDHRERAQVSSRLPPLDAVVEVDAEVLAKRLVSLPDEANALVRLLDGKRTLREVIAVSGQDVTEASAVLARLHGQGILRVGASSAAGPAVEVPATTPTWTAGTTPAPDGVEWFAAPEDAGLAASSEGAGEFEPEPHGPADIPADRPEPGGVGWVRAFLARLRA
jgi:hypothetical protein